MELGTDGLVRLTLNEVLSIPLTHLISGVDEELADQRPECGSATVLTGYTEWCSTVAPAIVMGWDWMSVCDTGAPRLARVGPPRCNIMLVDHVSADLDWDRQLEILGTVIDAMDWARQTEATISSRYR